MSFEVIFQKQSDPNSEMALTVVPEFEMKQRSLALKRLRNVRLACWVNRSPEC